MSDKEQRSDSANEWTSIFQQIEGQVRREAARAVGVPEDSDWATIGHQTDDAVRTNVAKSAQLPEDADWETIGRHLETSGRSGIARFVGASEEADWATIGQKVEERVKTFLDDLFRSKPAGKADEGPVDPWSPDDQ